VGLLTLSVLLSLASPQVQNTSNDVGTQAATVLTITKHVEASYQPSRVPVNGSWSGGTQQDIRLGDANWSVENALYEGKPCKLFKGSSTWQYKPKINNKKVIFNPTLYFFAQISPEGRLLHTNTSYAGFGFMLPVQIDAIYNKDSIDITKIEGRSVSRSSLYPNFSMDLFDNLFNPLVKDGLVVAQERQLAFLHPITGAPCIITAKVHGRFDGKLYFRSYQGYKIETTSPESPLTISSMVSRHGQLLQINLQENTDAVAYTPLTNEEEQNWGKFKPEDWDLPASVTHPARSRYRTLGVPILLTKPSPLLVPIPYAMAT
jgi:hypothetical protein